MTRYAWSGAIGLLCTVVLAGCPGRGGEERAPGEAAQPSPEPRGMGGGMMGDGMMGGMMRGAADTAAAPHAEAAAATAPGCPAISQPLVETGRRLFTGGGNCYACHGSNAKGGPTAPDLTDGTWLNIDGSYAATAQLVRQGVPQPKRFPVPMPPRGGAALDSLQVCAVAAYVYSLGH